MSSAKRLPLEAVPAVFSTATALEHGFTEKQLRGRRLARLSRGRYADADAAQDWHRLAAALAGRPPGSALSDVTAARLWNLPTPWSLRDDTRIHVCVPVPHRATRRAGTVAHQRLLLPCDVTERSSLPVTSLARTFVDLAATAELEEIVAVGDAILRTGGCGLARLTDRVHLATGRRGLAKAIAALPMLDARAQSAPESVLRVRAVAEGLPPPEPQCPVLSPSGRIIAHLDLGYREYRVGLEHDGRHHTEPRQFAIDVERHSALSAADWLVVRSSAADLAGGSKRVLGMLGDALVSRGWRPEIDVGPDTSAGRKYV